MGFPIFSTILGGLNLGSSIYNTNSQSETNQAQIDYARESRDLGRKWSLEDWQRQVDYNSPRATMQRYADAGLNPHLIYGRANDAPPVRSSEQPQPNLRAPQIDPNLINSLMQGFLSSFELEKTKAQTDNVKANTDLIMANYRLSQLKGDTAAFDLDFKKSTLDYSSDFLRLRNKNLASDLLTKGLTRSNLNSDLETKAVNRFYTLQQNERAAAMNAANVNVAVARILHMRADMARMDVQKWYLMKQADNAEKDGQLKQLDINLRQKGIYPNDPAWLRIVGQAVGGYSQGAIPGQGLDADLLNPLLGTPGSWQKK